MKVEAYGDLAAAASKLAISLDRCQAGNVAVNNRTEHLAGSN